MRKKKPNPYSFSETHTMKATYQGWVNSTFSVT